MLESSVVSAADTSDRPLRADAERNRLRILQVARELFATRGLDVSLDEVAADAGVGVGTVYRRFTDKDGLIEALFEDKIAQLAAIAHAGLGHEDPWEGFCWFMWQACTLQAGDRGLKEALHIRGRGGERVARARDTIAPVVTRLLERAQAAGQVRDDVNAFDIPLTNFAVGFVADQTRDGAPDYWQRTLTILLDGLAARRDAPTAMPAAPLEVRQFVAAMSRERPR